jgi:hypothetical protein
MRYVRYAHCAWWARPTLALRARGCCAVLFNPCILTPLLRAERTTHPPAPIPFAHCPNECLYQFGSRSVQPFGRLCWICVHGCTLALAHPLYSWHRPNESLCECWNRSAQPFGFIYWTCDAVRTRRPPYLHRIVPMSVCANVGPDRPSRFAAYTGQHNTRQRPF